MNEPESRKGEEEREAKGRNGRETVNNSRYKINVTVRSIAKG